MNSPLIASGSRSDGDDSGESDRRYLLMSFQKLYVGNLNYKTTEDTLKQLFAQYGEVTSVNILQGRGFGFVEMATPEAAQEAKGKLNGSDFDGRKIIVNDARPRAERPRTERRPGGGERKGFSRF
jgi:RNA recognition motif-containing protein